MPASLQLTLESNRRPERVAELARELATDLSRFPELQVRPATRPSEVGEKSAEAALLGQFVLTFLTGGAAKALLGCLQGYLQRDRSLVITFKTPGGTELQIKGGELQPEKVGEIVEALGRLDSETG
jgi:hypothetical protein